MMPRTYPFSLADLMGALQERDAVLDELYRIKAGLMADLTDIDRLIVKLGGEVIRPAEPVVQAGKAAGSGASQLKALTMVALSPKNELLNRKDAAAYLGVKPETLAVWAATRRYGLPMVKVGRLARYRRSDLDAFIESRTQQLGVSMPASRLRPSRSP